MASLLYVPAVAANASEALLSDWLVRTGESYSPGTPLAVIETEKAAVEVEAETTGVVLHFLVPAGASVEVGQAIALVGSEGEVVSDLEGTLRQLGVATEGGGLDDVSTRAVALADVEESAASQSATVTATPTRAASRLFASPLARKLAATNGVDLAAVEGSGPGGRIRRRDVLAAVAAVRAAETVHSVPAEATEELDEGRRSTTPHTRMRRAIASRLQESKRNAPHFYVKATCRVDDLLGARQRLNAVGDSRISLNDLVVKAAGFAHSRVPEMNVVWTDDEVVQFGGVDLAIAVATDTGLVAPVIRGVERMALGDIARSTADFARRARDGRISPDELVGGTLTITNLGMFGVEEFAAIINPPHAGILAVGAAQDSAVVVGGNLTVAKTMTVVLSVDHRPVDGTIAARWLEAFRTAVEDPMLLLL
jgi:pyruvate dehydrogenase E2 component (dihydrolipoamide acetyltransferase)